LAFNNFVLFDRVHLPIRGKRPAAVVEEDLLPVRESVRAKTGAVMNLALLLVRVKTAAEGLRAF
jgi:hypothetical protein